MAVRMDVTFAFFTAFIGAIKNGEVFVLQERCTFYGHCSTDKVVSCVYLFIGKTKRLQQAPLKIEILFGLESEALQAFLTQCIHVEYKTYFKCAGYSGIQLFDLFS